MENSSNFDVIIVGGSYAGLAAAMSLGRALRKVLVIDSGKPCNAQTPHSHNFLTQDGRPPGQIAANAKQQVEQYDSVQFFNGRATEGKEVENGFEIRTDAGQAFTARKLIFATGLKDIMPDIDGFAECWGISVLHCPYCHGYEVSHKKTAIIANGEKAYHYAQLISNWTDHLVLLTDGASQLTEEQSKQVVAIDITIVEKKIERLHHSDGKVEKVIFNDQSEEEIEAIYSGPEVVQHCDIPSQLGCRLNDEGLIEVDDFQKTSVEDVYACGDNSNFRSVSLAVSSGSIAGVVASKELIADEFERA